MIPTISIMTEYKPGRHGLLPASAPVHVTPEVMAAAASTVASRPAETGAILTCVHDKSGVDRLDFDVVGSLNATRVTYLPDNAWANGLLDQYARERPCRLNEGLLHSHPDGYEVLSGIGHTGKGDMSFARATLAANEHMVRCVMFLITGAGSGKPKLWPWVVERESQDRPRFAPIVIADVSQFPPRQFPPEFAARVKADVVALPLIVGLHQAQLAEYARSELEVRGRVIATSNGTPRVEIHLPLDFPYAEPVVVIVVRGATHVLRPTWKAKSRHALELRLGTLIRNARTFAKEV